MQTVTEILIDFSSSMKERLSLTKQILLADVIPNLDYSAKIGVKTFMAKETKGKASIIPILPLSICNKEQLTNAINNLGEPDGNTPIAQAIAESVATLKEYKAFDKKIILVTDGEENCHGDYELEAKKAGSEGVFCEIHIIGIGLQSQEIVKAQTIASLTKGTFSNIKYSKGTIYNQETVVNNLSNFIQAVNKPIINSNSVYSTNIEAEILVLQDEKQTIIVEPSKLELQEDEIDGTNLSISEAKQNEENETILKSIVDELKKIKAEITDLKQESIKDESIEIIEDKELNERIRKASESYLFTHLKKKYADRINWLNENGEAFNDHDFEVIDMDTNFIEYHIECKGTLKDKKTFYLTKDEWRLFLNHTKNYQIYMVFNVFNNPNHIFIDNLFDWILKGKIVPYSITNERVKAERITLTIIE